MHQSNLKVGTVAEEHADSESSKLQQAANPEAQWETKQGSVSESGNTAASAESRQQKRAPLYLDEAVKAQNERLEGNVLLLRPVGHTLFAGFFLVVIATLILFISFGSYTRKATVMGSLKPTEGMTKIYADGTGIVSEIFVSAGDVVKKGQPIVRLNRDQFMSDMENISEFAVEQLQTTIASLESQLHNLAERYALEEKQLMLHRDNMSESIASLDRQLNLIEDKYQIKATRFASMLDLASKNFVAPVEIEQLRSDLFDAELQVKQVESTLMDRQHTLDDINVKLTKIPSQKLFEAEQIRQQIAQHRQALVDAKASRENVVVATADGRVATILAEQGNPVSDAVPLLTLVPEWSVMEAEVYVPASAISFVTAGQEVRLQYQAIPVQRYGTFPGTVKSVSETTINPGELKGPFRLEQPVYRLIVEIPDQNISIQNQTFPLMPGMIIELDLLAEEQTILEWLLEPVWDVKERF